jgi:mannose-6-phosphate isomerase-like protein (cupin superfamily)
MATQESAVHPVSAPFISKDDRQEINWSLGGEPSRLVVHADGQRTGGAVSVAEHYWPAGSAGGLHSHGLEDEGFYVIEGELTVTMPDLGESYEVGPGDFLWHPRLSRHDYAVSEAGPARVLQFLVPGGDLVPGFFADIEAGRSLDDVVAWGKKDYGVDFYEGSEPPTVNQQLLADASSAGPVPLRLQPGTGLPEAGSIPYQPVSNKPFKSDRAKSEIMQIGRGMMTDVGMIFHAFGFQTGNTFGLIEIDWGPGDVAGPHVHHLEDEGFFVLEGELTMHVAGVGQIPVQAGEFVWAPRGIPHYYSVTGEKGARVLVFEVPGGTLMDFFYRTATEGHGTDIESDEDLQRFVEWTSQNFGIDFMDPDMFPEEG